MNKNCKKIVLLCLLCMFVVVGLTACGGEKGVKVNSANTLARKLASDSAVKINVSEDIYLEEPIIVNGEKEIVGNGKIIAAIEDGADNYMITVSDGGKLTVGGSTKLDASGLMGGVHVQEGGTAVISDKAVIMNASETTANALVEGSLEVSGGTLKDAKGHNIYNKKETAISGGEIIGSGEKYAGVYNEGTLTQTGGKIEKAYNNVSNISGSTFTFEGGTNKKSIRDGIFVAEGATLKATKKEAVVEEAGARGILLFGKADIKVITVQTCNDTLIKVGKTGVLNLGNGIIQDGNYHGVYNAGTMNMLGGNIQKNRHSGIVNTGVLNVTSGNIAENADKGIVNKHRGEANITSAMVTFTSNKIAIANEDQAVFEFAKAKLLMSTQTNVYCYDGTINMHDISLNASTSNNVRVVSGVINMKNVEVKGNSQKSNASHHGIIMDGGTINAEDVTVSMTTGCGMRIKGGVFKGKNIKMHDINRTAISMGEHDQLKDAEGLVDIDNLTIESTNYNNVLNEGGGTIKIKNAKLAVATSNSVRSEGGKTELANVTVPGHKEGSKDNIHGIYLEGGEIVAKNVTVQNTSGNALRNKNGKFVGKNIKLTNIKGQSAIWNLPLSDTEKNGIIDIDGLTIKNSVSKNITLDCGVTTIKNATLGKTGGNSIKMQNNAATLNLYNVKIEGQKADATANTHGIMVEGGNVFGENIEIAETKACGIRCKMGKVDLKNVTMNKLGQAGVSNSKMTKNGELKGEGEVKIDGLKITNAGTNNVVADAGKVTITNGVLGKVETVNHNTKVTNTAVLTLTKTEIQGTKSGSRHALIAEKGGCAVLTDVIISDAPGNAIHVNHKDCKVTGTNVTIKDSTNGAFSSAGTIKIKNLVTENISNNSILVRNEGNVIATKSTLGATKGHNVKSEAGAKVKLVDTIVDGLAKDAAGDKRAIIAEGGAVELEKVTVKNAKSSAIHANRATSDVVGKDVIIKDCGSALTGTKGNMDIDGLTTENIKYNNVFSGSDDAEKSEEQCVITVKNGELCKTPEGHNVKTTMNGNVVLNKVTVYGTEANDKYGIIVEKGSSVKLKEVTIQDVPAKSAIYSNHVDNVITGNEVTIKNAPIAILMKFGSLDVDGLTTENIKDKNIMIDEVADNDGKTEVSVKNAELCKTSSHNVHIKDENASVALDTVEILGTSSNHGVMAEGGDATLKEVTIQDVAGTGIRINKATSEVKGTNVTILNSGYGITGTNGTVNLKELSTSGITGNNLLAESNCSITVDGAGLGKTGGHNVKNSGSKTIVLKNTFVYGTSSASHHGIMAEGGDIELYDVEISDVKANDSRAAIRVNKDTSKITGKDVTITDSSVGIIADKGEVEIQDLTSSATVRSVDALGATISIKNGTLNTTTSYNVEETAGELTLENVDVKGGTYGIYKHIPSDSTANGGVLKVKEVTIIDSVKEGIWQEAGSISGAKLELKNTGGPAIENKSGASVEISDLTVSGVKSGHSIKNEDSGSNVVINGATIGQTPSNNIYVSGGTVTIKDATIEGTVANHGVLAQGGAVVLENVTIKNAAQAGIRANRTASDVKGKNITITSCADGITVSDGTVEVENLDTTGVTGIGIKSSKSIKVSGKVIATILLEESVSLEATKALTESVITLDWAEDKLPTDFVAIQFADEDAMNATKANSSIKLGAYAGDLYKTVYSGTQLRLKVDSIEVSNETELLAAFETIANSTKKTGLIELTGNIENTQFTTLPENVVITITDDGNARTIKRTSNSGNLYKIPVNTTLTLLSSSSDNANPTLIIDGGSGDGKTGTAMLENYGTLTVNSGVALQNNTASTNNQGIALYSQAGSTTTFKGVLKNIVSTYTGDSSPSAVAVKGTVNFENAVVDGLKTNKHGMIRVFDKATISAKNTEFKNNQSGADGGIIYAQADASVISFEGCTFTGNSATGNGGAVFVAEDATITNCKFDGNTSSKNGGAIYNASSANLTIVGDGTNKSAFTNNKATGQKTEAEDATYYGGGAICVGSGTLSVSGYKFTSNETNSDGGAINNRGTTVTINSCEFTSNKAVKHTKDGYGGAIFMFQGTLNVDKDQTTVSKFESNHATNGGAIYQRAGVVVIHNANFTSNRGDWNGGAVYHKKETTLLKCSFTSNTAVSKGGAVCSEGGTTTATNCTFTGNSSDDEGGAYRLAASGKGTFTGCTFTNNTAKKTGGGAIKFNTGTLTLDGCTLSGNTATKGDTYGHDIKLSTTTTKPTIKNSKFNPSNVRDSEGTVNAYTDGGGNKQ